MYVQNHTVMKSEQESHDKSVLEHLLTVDHSANPKAALGYLCKEPAVGKPCYPGIWGIQGSQVDRIWVFMPLTGTSCRSLKGLRPTDKWP